MLGEGMAVKRQVETRTDYVMGTHRKVVVTSQDGGMEVENKSEGLWMRDARFGCDLTLLLVKVNAVQSTSPSF